MRWLRLAYAAVIGIAVTCTVDLSLSPCPAAGCPAPTHALSGAVPVVAALASLVVVVTLSRAILAAQGARRALEALLVTTTTYPDRVPRHLGCGPIRFIALHEPIAMCSGVVRPAIFVSTGLVRATTTAELRAILVHEATHRRRRDPLRRALRNALADALFFVPLVSWWARRAAVHDELIADRAAVERCGVATVVHALMIASGGVPDAVAAFGGATAARLRSLEGGPARLGWPPVQQLAMTVLGSVAAALTIACVISMLAR